ncbi:MAG: hypothetical protein M3220_05270, partial [Chloroflexota bacterium]|nr:hypothetical protein [Chloroflexota bacterium]
LARLKQEQHNTIIVIEHSLEHLVPLADRMVLLSDGEIVLAEETVEFFRRLDILESADVVAPGAIAFFQALMRQDAYDGEIPLTLDAAVERLHLLIGVPFKERGRP